MKEQTEIIEFYEDPSSGKQLFQIHELIPQYKIDRIVYREKSREGWFKEISSQDYFAKVTTGNSTACPNLLILPRPQIRLVESGQPQLSRLDF